MKRVYLFKKCINVTSNVFKEYQTKITMQLMLETNFQ